MIRLGELMMILELHRQGLSITAIARRTGRDPKTVRKYVERGVEAPVYGPRARSVARARSRPIWRSCASGLRPFPT
jgi:transposase